MRKNMETIFLNADWCSIPYFLQKLLEDRFLILFLIIQMQIVYAEVCWLTINGFYQQISKDTFQTLS